MQIKHFKRKTIYVFMTLILILMFSLTALADVIFIEAESGTQDAASPMKIGSGDGAFNDKYIYGETNSDEKITYNFEIKEAGNYYLWFRLMGQDDNTNSLFVMIDGAGFDQAAGFDQGVYYTFDMWEPSEGFDYATNNPFLPTLEHMKDAVWDYNPNWHWIPLSYRDATGATPVRFNLITQNFTAGKHTIEIMTREPTTYLDKIIITNDLTYDPRAITGDPEVAYTAAQTAAQAQTVTEAPAAAAETPVAVAAVQAPVAVAPAAVPASVRTADDGMIYILIFMLILASFAVVRFRGKKSI